MTRIIPTTLLLAATLLGLAGCGGSKPVAGGNVTMRDMEVVDGTANDSTADLDNATQDGTLLSNSGKATATGSRGESKAVDDETANSSAKSDQAKGASKEPASNASAPQ